MNRSASISTLLPLLLGATALTPAALGQFYSVGRPPGGSVSSRVNGLSSDGTVAAGHVRASGTDAGFRWTLSEGRYDFGRESGMPTFTHVLGLSGDGRFVVGSHNTAEGRVQAFRWSGATSIQSLGSVGGPWVNSIAVDASANGDVVVGSLYNDDYNFFQPFRWTASGGMQALNQNGSFFYGEANAVSDDGNTVVGQSIGASRGFVWTTTTGYRLLDVVPGTDEYSTARGISRDGSFIVGDAGVISTGAMWTRDGAIDLGKLPGYRAFAASEVNDAGTIVAGTSSGFQLRATIWTQGRGIELLSDYLDSQGVTIPMNVVLSECTSMSADGMTFAGQASIAGQSNSSFGYVVTVPQPSGVLALLTVGVLPSSYRRRK